MNVFGGLLADAMTPYAVRGYFDNWATTAHIVRLLGAGSQTAAGTWVAGSQDSNTKKPDSNWPGDSGLPALSFVVSATSPGDWANGVSFTARYWARGASGNPEMEIEVVPPDEPAETLTGIHPQTIIEEVNAQSHYIRLSPQPLPAGLTADDLQSPKAPARPRYFQWARLP